MRGDLQLVCQSAGRILRVVKRRVAKLAMKRREALANLQAERVEQNLDTQMCELLKPHSK